VWQRWLSAAWDGVRLTCPACRNGPIFRNMTDRHETCPNCGISFEPNEGDFLGAMTVAYAVTAVLVVFGILTLELLTDLTAYQHLIIWGIFSVAFLILCYRNLKGLWIGILYAMTGLRREY
jgi:uncharacterized protein (DUF983 family)